MSTGPSLKLKISADYYYYLFIFYQYQNHMVFIIDNSWHIGTIYKPEPEADMN